MNAIDFKRERFFKQDLVNKHVTSYSLGNTWYYFYRDTLIGVRKIGDDKEAYFLADDELPLKNDNYTSQHFITPDLLAGAIADKNDVKRVMRSDLVEHAIRLGKEAMAAI